MLVLVSEVIDKLWSSSALLGAWVHVVCGRQVAVLSRELEIPTEKVTLKQQPAEVGEWAGWLSGKRVLGRGESPHRDQPGASIETSVATEEWTNVRGGLRGTGMG